MRALVPIVVLALSACGQGSADNSSQPVSIGDATRVLDRGGNPNAAGVGNDGAGTADAEGINCNGLAVPNGPDVVGVSIGMSAEDAYRAIACSNRALRVAFNDQGGFAVPPSADGQRPRTMITGESGQERITAALVGLPGQERVVTIRRNLEFAQGEESAVTNLIAQLEQKYGSLAHNPNQYGAWTGLSLRDARNQPLTTEGNLLGSRCAMSVGSQMGQPDLIAECGLSVGVHINFRRDNQQLAERLVVTMSNGAFGMEQIAALQAQARGAAQQRQAQEVNDAQGRRPTL